MSLKSMISGKSEEDKVFQNLIRECLPQKGDFVTVSGIQAFTKYEELIPYELNNSAEAGTVGTAFDYLARAIVAKRVCWDKEKAIFDLKAIHGLYRIKNKIDEKLYVKLQNRYSESLSRYIDYIYSDDSNLPKADDIFQNSRQEELDAWFKYMDRASLSIFRPITNIQEIIEDAYYFAKLEEIFRSGGILPEKGIENILLQPSKIIRQDLNNLCDIFRKVFIDNEIIGRESIVIFNPSFGIGTLACEGADADIYIDGVLYDFKTSKKTGFSWKESAQLTMYFYLNRIAKLDEKEREGLPAQLKDYKILKLAIYRARYGQIEYCDAKFFDDELHEDNFEKVLNYLIKRLKKQLGLN